jgi:hypothetical protein
MAVAAETADLSHDLVLDLVAHPGGKQALENRQGVSENHDTLPRAQILTGVAQSLVKCPFFTSKRVSHRAERNTKNFIENTSAWTPAGSLFLGVGCSSPAVRRGPVSVVDRRATVRVGLFDIGKLGLLDANIKRSRSDVLPMVVGRSQLELRLLFDGPQLHSTIDKNTITSNYPRRPVELQTTR